MLILLEHIVPICIKERTATIPLPQVDPTWFVQKAEEWGVFAMSENEFLAFEKKQHSRFADLLTAVSPELKEAVFTRVLDSMNFSSKAIGKRGLTQNDKPTFQPLSQLPVFSKLIDEMLLIAQENYENLQAARSNPAVLDDEIVKRAGKVFSEMQNDLTSYDEQLRKWKQEPLSSRERREINRLFSQIKKVRATVSAILALADIFKEQTIEKVLTMDDAQLARKTLTDPGWPGVDELLSGAALGLDALFMQAEKIGPQLIRRFTTQPARNALEALLLLVDEILARLQGKDVAVPPEVRIELARLLACEFAFSPAWPYTGKQMQAALTPGHPDLRPSIVDSDIVVIATEVEKLLITKLQEEKGEFRDPTQAGMCVVYLTHDTLFGKSQVPGGDAHEMYHVARVLARAYQFSPAWPYSTEQIRVALRTHFGFGS